MKKTLEYAVAITVEIDGEIPDAELEQIVLDSILENAPSIIVDDDELDLWIVCDSFECALISPDDTVKP